MKTWYGFDRKYRDECDAATKAIAQRWIRNPGSTVGVMNGLKRGQKKLEDLNCKQQYEDPYKTIRA